jgi:ADP-ribosylglycohydrolase
LQSEVICVFGIHFQVTHADPRCVVSSVAVTVAIAMLLQNQEDEKFIQNVTQIALKHFQVEELLQEEKNDEFVQEFVQSINASSYDELKLDENGKIGYSHFFRVF